MASLPSTVMLNAMAGLGRYQAAEPFLLEGYEKMQPPPDHAQSKTSALERLVALYEAWGKDAEAAKWRRKLASTRGRTQ